MSMPSVHLGPSGTRGEGAAAGLLEGVTSGLFRPSETAPAEYKPMLIANRPNGITMREALGDEIASSDSFDMSVAFVSAGALLSLFEDFRAHARRRKETGENARPSRLITSTKSHFNDPKAFWELLHLQETIGLDVRVWAAHGRSPADAAAQGQPFHPKGYVFARHLRDGRPYYNLYVGSSNLTGAALNVQREWNLKVSSLDSGELVGQVRRELESQIDDSTPLTEEWIRQYEEDFKRYAPPRQEILASLESRATIEPNAMQREALNSLADLRAAGERRAVVISATGTGKTYLSAFDVRACHPRRMLYIAQQQQILTKAMESYQRVLGCDPAELGLYAGGSKQHDRKYVFATVQTMSGALDRFASDEFDYVLIDEAHHAGADSYRKVIEHFRDAGFMLGMTATPERLDGFNIFELFGHNIAYEIRLRKALDEGMLCPFHYYGVAEYIGSDDAIDIAQGTAGDRAQLKYEISQLASGQRVRYIIDKLQEYGQFGVPVTGLVFCSRQEEAHELSRLFNQQMNQQAERLYRTAAVTSTDENGRHIGPNERDEYVKRLERGELDYLFTVDLFNEGVDIPAVNQIVMLRSTQSSIVFTQQLGRGLRKFPHKDGVVVIDFIGNYANNYLIPVALYGNTGDRDVARRNLQRRSIGLSSISFDPIARDRILRSLDMADWSDMKRLTAQYRLLRRELGRIPMLADVYRHDPSLPFTLASKSGNYLEFVRSRERSLDHRRTGEPSYADELEPVSEAGSAMLKMLTELLLPGLRPHELVILDRLARASEPTPAAQLAEAIREACPSANLSESQFDSAIRVLGYSYFTDANRRRFGGRPLIEAVGSAADSGAADGSEEAGSACYRLSPWLAAELAGNRTLRAFFDDTLRVGLLNCRDLLADPEGRERPLDHGFRYGRKYTMADVMRLCGWQREATPQNVGGYKFDKDTNTMPIFVKYAASQYEDEFLNSQEMRYYSKNKRTPESPEFRWLRTGRGPEWGRTHFVPLFVMRKAESQGSRYYYVGHAEELADPTLIVKPDADGMNEVKVTVSTLRLAEPIDPELYRHLIG